MQEISESVAKFLDKQKLGYVATASSDGIPNLSPKGTIIVLDKRTLAFADIRSPVTMKNLEENPNLEINTIDPLIRKGFRFRGKSTIITKGSKYDEILDNYRKRGVKSPIGAIVLVHVSEFSEVISPLYDLGVTEEEIKENWKKRLLNL